MQKIKPPLTMLTACKKENPSCNTCFRNGREGEGAYCCRCNNFNEFIKKGQHSPGELKKFEVCFCVTAGGTYNISAKTEEEAQRLAEELASAKEPFDRLWVGESPYSGDILVDEVRAFEGHPGNWDNFALISTYKQEGE